MTVLVTGPTGPVGQYVLEQLLVGDEPIRVLALPETLHRIPYRNRVDIIPGSLLDADAVRQATDGINVVYHTAQLMPPPSIDPEELRRVNVDGTRNLIKACVGVARRFVFFSTNNVYTPHIEPDTWPVTENAPRLAHGNPQAKIYGQSMIDAQDILLDAHERHAVEFCILQPTVICGRSGRFSETLVTTLLRRPDRAGVINDRWGMMQWIHGSDLGRIGVVAGTHAGAANQTFIVAGDQPIRSFDVVALLWSIMNPAEPWNPYQDEADAHNPGLRKFDCSKIQNALGFKARVTVRQCLEEILGRIEFYTSAGIDLLQSSAAQR